MTELTELFEEDEQRQNFKTGAKIWIAVIFAQLFTAPLAFVGGKMISVFPSSLVGIALSMMTLWIYIVLAIIVLGVVGRYLWDWK